MRIPNEDRIFVVPDSAEKKTASGLIIPDTAQEKPCTGTVKYIGEGNPGKPMKILPGFRVSYPKHAGTFHVIEGEEGLIMRQGEVMSYDLPSITTQKPEEASALY